MHFKHNSFIFWWKMTRSPKCDSVGSKKQFSYWVGIDSPRLTCEDGQHDLGDGGGVEAVLDAGEPVLLLPAISPAVWTQGKHGEMQLLYSCWSQRSYKYQYLSNKRLNLNNLYFFLCCSTSLGPILCTGTHILWLLCHFPFCRKISIVKLYLSLLKCSVMSRIIGESQSATSFFLSIRKVIYKRSCG